MLSLEGLFTVHARKAHLMLDSRKGLKLLKVLHFATKASSGPEEHF